MVLVMIEPTLKKAFDEAATAALGLDARVVVVVVVVLRAVVVFGAAVVFVPKKN